ncbi:MAG: NAD-dependent epimerase/dehydratase family protein [Pseudomonadota bacterium]
MAGKKKTVLVCGAGGFIGTHLVERFKAEGCWVHGIDLKAPEFCETAADEFTLADLRDPGVCRKALANGFDEVYQLAADMGGAGYLFTGENDADVMHNSSMINLNILSTSRDVGVGKIFYASSACIYPEYNQTDPDNPNCSEDSAYPAQPDSEYGWEKLFSERLYASYLRNYNVDVRIGRFHNIFGPLGTWTGGKEKAPAAMCRKVAQADDGGEIEIWGDGQQTRSFLYIDECVESVQRLMHSDYREPINIGSSEMIRINALADLVAEVANKQISIKNVAGPEGVRGRNSDNVRIEHILNWKPSASLKQGLKPTYEWIRQQVGADNMEPAH